LSDLKTKIVRVVLISIVCFLITIGVGASIAHFFQNYYNPDFFKHPIIVSLHVILGAFFLAFAPFQFITKIRKRWINYHRWIGRILLGLGLIIGTSAIFMAVIIPFSGVLESFVNGFFGVFFLFAMGKGFFYIRSHQIELHREWMIRTFAIGLAIATMRLIFIPLLIISKHVTPEIVANYSIVSF
jgi:uncharacterized membrane protein